jgi:glycosyltransferase involved in cell wall biosynthesis
MKEKRVCIISKFLYENDTRLQQQAKTLYTAGAKVDILCLRSNETNQYVDRGITVYGVTKPIPKETIAKYLLSTLMFALSCFVKLQKLTFKKKYDLIVVHTLPEFLVFIAIFQKMRGTKILLDVRDTSVELFAAKWGKDNRKLLMKFVIVSSNLACKYADKIITASRGFYDKLIERDVPANQIDIIYNSADTSVFKFDSTRKFDKITSEAKLIYHGSISERFGIDVAIHALKLLQDKIPGTQLSIFGFYDEDYKILLENTIIELELQNFVFLNGRQSLENIYNLILKSDIGLVPYRSDDFMQLALSTKMFEYVNSGIPVVASRLSPAEFVFDDTCILYSTPNNPKAIADNIERFCLNPELRRSCVKNAFHAHQKVSGEEMSKLYLDIVRSLTTLD